MVLFFERKSEERGWIPLDPKFKVASIEQIKIGHSYFWFIVYEDNRFEKLPAKEFRLKKVAEYEQTTFVFE